MSNYTSSLVNKYGDTSKVRQDAKTLKDILSRQGTSLFIDVIADRAGHAANRFKMNEAERMKLLKNLVEGFKESLKECL